MDKPLSWRSQWLETRIRHRRFSPVEHQFSYVSGLFSVDLAEWHTLNRLSPLFSTRRFNWVTLRREDYFCPEQPDIETAVRDHVLEATGWRPDGPIELITHPRYLGQIFNPVSFYHCYEKGASPSAGHVPRVILAQITNTPWRERHTYCLEGGDIITGLHGWKTRRFTFAKAFHVSPFNPMDQDYDWLFSFRPGECRIHMNLRQDGRKVFDATMEVKRHTLNRKTFHRALRRFPLETVKVVAAIYWQALRLKLKGATFHDHPQIPTAKPDAENRPPDSIVSPLKHRER